MIISYVGNRNNLDADGKSFNTENHIALTLEKLGHTVNFIQEDEIQFGSLPNMVGEADLFLWTRTWPDKVLLDDLYIIGKRMPTVSFHLDKYTGIARNGGLATDAFWRTQYVFSPEGSNEAKHIFRQHKINQFYLPAGVFEDEARLATRPYHDRYVNDIIFVGGGKQYAHPEWPYRAKLVTWLEDTYGSRFKKFGWPERTVRGLDLNLLYADTKIVIGDSLCKDFKDSYYWSDRIYETTGRGGFLIHPRIKGIEEHFNDRKEVVFYDYNDFEQLKGLIDFYLENDKPRELIRKRGHERTKRDHTYTQRMKQMLETLKREGAIK